METHYQRARKLLQMLPALRGLQLADFDCSDELTSLFDIPMSHLRCLIFTNRRCQSSIHEPTKAITLPQIQRISISFKDTASRRIDPTRKAELVSTLRRPRETFIGTSSLKELTLKTCTDWIALDTDLLELPSALEKLRCEFGYSGYLTPRATTAALRPLYSTLVFLDLNYHYITGTTIGRVADFSLFICLQTLIVDAFLCFGNWSSDKPDARCGFYKRLPSTLRTLKMKFNRWWVGIGLDQQNEKSYSWVMELAEHKSTVLPSLEIVELEQYLGEQIEWEWYPDDLQEVFWNAGIDLFIAEPTFVPDESRAYFYIHTAV